MAEASFFSALAAISNPFALAAITVGLAYLTIRLMLRNAHRQREIDHTERMGQHDAMLKAHRDDVDRMFTLFSKNAETLEEIGKQMTALGTLISGNQYCPLMRRAAFGEDGIPLMQESRVR